MVKPSEVGGGVWILYILEGILGVTFEAVFWGATLILLYLPCLMSPFTSPSSLYHPRNHLALRSLALGLF